MKISSCLGSLSLVMASLTSMTAMATDYFVVTPIHGRAAAIPAEPDPVVVELVAAALPDATAWSAYHHHLWNDLRVSGDPDFKPDEVVFYAPNQLPPGLTLRSDGVLEGVPTANGASSFQVVASYRSESGSAQYLLNIGESLVVVTLWGFNLERAAVGKAYQHDFNDHLVIENDNTPENERPAVTWSAQDLPAGMYLTADGVLNGAPTEKTEGNGAGFYVEASYKDKSSQEFYMLEVGGRLLSVAKLSVGSSTNCAITPQGALYCWGENASGQLGANVQDFSSATPVLVDGMSQGVTHVSVGINHVCAVQTGAVKCWGNNAYGQIGAPTSQYSSSVPIQVPNLTSGVTAISVGGGHTCAIHNGAAKCWGLNDKRALGNSSTANSHIPVQVVGLTGGVVSIAAGMTHSCATHHYAVKCWGSNEFNQLGIAANQGGNLPVTAADLGSGATRVVVGTSFSCAVHNGVAKCWGDTQLGTTSGAHSTPIPVPGITGTITDFTAFLSGACVVTSGVATCWGRDINGSLGTGTPNAVIQPTQVQASAAVSGIGVGSAHGCVVIDQEAKCYGSGWYGQLGKGIPSDGSVITPKFSVEE